MILEAPLSAYGWLVASIMLWVLLYQSIRFSLILKVSAVKLVALSFLLIALSFTFYSAATFLAPVEPQILTIGFLVGDFLSVSFLAIQPLIAWTLYGKRFFARWQLVSLLVILGVFNFVVKIQPLIGDSRITISEGELVKMSPGPIVAVIELFFLSGLLLTGLNMLMRAGSAVVASSRLKYMVLGVFSIAGAGLYVADNTFIQSSGVGREIAIGNLVGYPLSVLIALAVFGFVGKEVSLHKKK